MGARQPPTEGDQQSGRVEIRVRGHLEPRWSDWLEGLTLTHQDDGTTVIEGPVADQAALFGVLQRLRDLALPLISILHIDPSEPCPPTPQNTTHHQRSSS